MKTFMTIFVAFVLGAIAVATAVPVSKDFFPGCCLLRSTSNPTANDCTTAGSKSACIVACNEFCSDSGTTAYNACVNGCGDAY